MLKYKGIPILASDEVVREVDGITVKIGPPQIVAARDDFPDEGTFTGPRLVSLGGKIYLNWKFDRDVVDGDLPSQPNGRVSSDGGLTWEKQETLMPAWAKYQTGEREVTSWFHNGFEIPGRPGVYRVPAWRSALASRRPTKREPWNRGSAKYPKLRFAAGR